MSTVYAVGCNFKSSELEREWNDWYNGPKMAQMLALPMFNGVQRFTACALDTGVAYLAVWLLESPDALTTPEYVSTWGFDRWAGEITDWTRDLITPLRAPLPPVPLAEEDGLLHVAWFDGSSNVERAMKEAEDAGGGPWWWGENSGLDESFSHIAIAAAGPEAVTSPARTFTDATRETILRPISRPGRAGGEPR
ncbi:hypothetical protein [Actinomadura roseirufa]|uniref:hypothetical protein n=1 Tax=Actinomadura roseirufa TaxID=2094049 RepID=UPI0010411D85|nr:hypothetical protein [Actinomadura roseirufa]